MTNPDNVGGLPELPRGILWRTDAQGWQSIDYSLFPSVGPVRYAYSEDQMRAYGELCRAAPAGGDDQKDYEMDKTIYDLAIHCGAHVDGGEYPDHSANFAGSPPTIEFTDRQLEKFVEKLLDGSYAYAGFQK